MSTDRSRLGKRSKRKGRDFEKAVAERVAEWLGVPVEEVSGARSGKKECDIQLSTIAHHLFPYHIEAKNHKSLSVPDWLRQASSDAALSTRKPTPEPVVVFKQHGDGEKWAIIRFEVFMELATRHLNDAEARELLDTLRKASHEG